MKFLLTFIVAFILVPVYAIAAISPSAPTYIQAEPAKSDVEKCLDLSDIASGIMKIRQYGTPISEAIEHFMQIPDLTQESKDYVLFVIEDAYAQPAYRTAEYRDTAIQEFGLLYFQACRG